MLGPDQARALGCATEASSRGLDALFLCTICKGEREYARKLTAKPILTHLLFQTVARPAGEGALVQPADLLCDGGRQLLAEGGGDGPANLRVDVGL